MGTGHAKQTVADCFNMMREVCTISIKSQPQLIGTGDVPIKIDNFVNSGNRKYNKGRLLHGNKKLQNEEDLKKVQGNIHKEKCCNICEERVKRGKK